MKGWLVFLTLDLKITINLKNSLKMTSQKGEKGVRFM